MWIESLYSVNRMHNVNVIINALWYLFREYMMACKIPEMCVFCLAWATCKLLCVMSVVKKGTITCKCRHQRFQKHVLDVICIRLHHISHLCPLYGAISVLICVHFCSQSSDFSCRLRQMYSFSDVGFCRRMLQCLNEM